MQFEPLDLLSSRQYVLFHSPFRLLSRTLAGSRPSLEA